MDLRIRVHSALLGEVLTRPPEAERSVMLMRDHGAGQPSGQLKHLLPCFGPATERLARRLGRAPKASELADELGMEHEEVVWGLVALGARDNTSIEHCEGSDCVGRGLGNHVTLWPLLAALSECERTVLVLRLFGHLKQSVIAERMGISQDQVSLLLARSLATLRKQMS